MSYGSERGNAGGTGTDAFLLLSWLLRHFEVVEIEGVCRIERETV